MNRGLSLALAAVAAAADAGLLLHWSRRPAVALPPGERLLWFGDDGLRTAAVTEGPAGRRMLVDGRGVAGSGTGLRAPVVLAQLPLMLGGGAREVLLFGWGAGAAAASALSHPIARLDAVERSSAVVAAAAVFEAAGRPLEDKRARLILARSWSAEGRLAAAYDVVLIEALPAGLADNTELYRLARARLRPGGLAAARVRVGSSPQGLRAELRRFHAHFPETSVWSVSEGEVILLGSRRRPAEVEALDRRFSSPGPAALLRPLGLSYPATLLSLQSSSERGVRAMARSDGPPLADDRARPEGRAQLLLARYLLHRGSSLRPREYLEILLHPRGARERGIFRGLLEEWVRRYPRDPRAVAFLYLIEERDGHAQTAAVLRARLSALRRRPDSGIEARREIVLPVGN